MQFLLKWDGSAEEYDSKRGWEEAEAPKVCPFADQGCGKEDCLVPHGTYPRKTPLYTRVRRFFCPTTKKTVSLLPEFMPARMTGSMEEVAEVAEAADAADAAAAGEAGTVEAAEESTGVGEAGTTEATEEAAGAGEERRSWRDLHPSAHVGSGLARRWALRRVTGLQELWKVLPTLLPDRLGGMESTLAGCRERLGLAEDTTGEWVLRNLRRTVSEHLRVLPSPVGFRTRRGTKSVNKVRSGAEQQKTGRSPPPAAGSELPDSGLGDAATGPEGP